jgi:hypothetical protein
MAVAGLSPGTAVAVAGFAPIAFLAGVTSMNWACRAISVYRVAQQKRRYLQEKTSKRLDHDALHRE